MEDWCTPAEEEYFLGRVYRPSGAVGDPWALVSGRRVQAHGGEVHEKGMIARPLPDWLGKLLKSIEDRMVDHAKNLEFEEAAKLRDQLREVREAQLLNPLS